MYGYIYLTTNLINNKKYIGQHKASQFDTKYKGSGKILSKAIKKYGFDNFKTEILYECSSKEELDSKEKYYILLYNADLSSDFYNITPGGSGGMQKGLIAVNNGEHKKLINKEDLQTYLDIGYKLGGLPQTKEVVQHRISFLKGRKASKETRLKLSKSLKGLKPPRTAIENSIKSRKESNFQPFSKGKVSLYNSQLDKVIFVEENDIAKYLEDGYVRGRRPQSDATKKKMSDSQKQLTCITNDIEIKFVKKDEVDQYISNGYRLGRIPTRPNQKAEHRKFMNKDGVQHMVKQDEWQTYLDNGYVFGRIK